MMPYALSEQTDASGVPVLVAAHAPVAFEYASLRRSAGLIDLAHRATIEITGSDRIGFLQRMLTQDLVGVRQPLPPLACVDSFWCNRKGRIDADLRLTLLEDRVLVDVDFHARQRFIETLDAFLIADDCELVDVTDRWHRLGLHGPASRSVLEQAAQLISGDPSAPNTASVWRFSAPGDEREPPLVIADHRPVLGTLGYELSVEATQVEAVVNALFAATGWEDRDPFAAIDPAAIDETPGADVAAARLRPVGWHAYNAARIEAGTPLYNLDFGPTSLPHETSVVADRVRFDKGCYLGQEVVARMQSLGHPKQRLVGLEIGTDAAVGDDIPQPIEGAAVLAETDGSRETVGVVTSSTISPMLGGKPIAFAMVKWAHSDPGSSVEVTAEGQVLKATVRESLVYWKSP